MRNHLRKLAALFKDEFSHSFPEPSSFPSNLLPGSAFQVFSRSGWNRTGEEGPLLLAAMQAPGVRLAKERKPKSPGGGGGSRGHKPIGLPEGASLETAESKCVSACFRGGC